MINCMAKEENLEKTVILHSTHYKTLSLPGRPSNNAKKLQSTAEKLGHLNSRNRLNSIIYSLEIISSLINW